MREGLAGPGRTAFSGASLIRNRQDVNAPQEPSSASPLPRVARSRRLAVVALCGVAAALMAGDTLAQDADHQIRCMQLQQELASAQGGGGRDALGGIDKQIQNMSRVYNGTKAAMDDAGCFERGFLIFGRGLVRSPKCLQMNNQVEDARRQLEQLQAQREAIAGGRGNRRRQAELMDALARNGCSGGRPMPQQTRRDGGGGGGGLFGWFGRGNDEEQQASQPAGPVYRSIDPNGRYRSVCVRTCDGFFFPVSYQTYSNRLSQDASVCQSSCAAPAELYVYRNPGQEIDQAISLNGTAYADLPSAFVYRKQYIKGCSCKADEYNPTEIEKASQKAEATPGKPGKPGKKAPAATQQAAAPAAPPPAPGELNLDVTGAVLAAPQAAAPAAAALQAAAPAPAPQAESFEPATPAQTSVIKRTPAQIPAP
jgi:hypothetical protein